MNFEGILDCEFAKTRNCASLAGVVDRNAHFAVDDAVHAALSGLDPLRRRPLPLPLRGPALLQTHFLGLFITTREHISVF